MRRLWFVVGAVSVVLLAVPAVWAQGGKSQLAVYVKNGNAAVNTMLGKPIELTFTASGRFATEKGKSFLSDIGPRATDSDIAEVARRHGIRFVCVIDASNVKLLPRPGGSASIGIFDVNAGRMLGTPQTVAIPPPNIANVGKTLLDLALSVAVDAAATTAQASAAGQAPTPSHHTAHPGRSGPPQTAPASQAAAHGAPTNRVGQAPTAPTVTQAPVQRYKPRLAIQPLRGVLDDDDNETITTLFSVQNKIRAEFNIVPAGQADIANYVLSGGHIRNSEDNTIFAVTVVDRRTSMLVGGGYHFYKDAGEISEVIPVIAGNIAASSKSNIARRKPSLIIAPFTSAGDIIESEESALLNQLLRIAMANTGAYAVMPSRAAVMRAALDELETLKSEPTIEDKAKAIGNISNADFVLFADMRNLGNTNTLIMQIFNASSGNWVSGASLNFNTIEEGAEKLSKVAAELASNESRPEPTIIAAAPQAAPAPRLTHTPAPSTAYRPPTQPVSGPSYSHAPRYYADDYDDDSDAWKNKWVYFGGSVGLGSTEGIYSYSCDWSGCRESRNNASAMSIAFVTDFALLPWFSIESGLMLIVNEKTSFGLPLIGKVGGRIGKIELTADTGPILGMGYTTGSTLGFKAGDGILYTRYAYIWPFDRFNETWTISVGLKGGVGNKRK